MDSEAGDIASTMNLSRFCAGLTAKSALNPANKQLSVLRKEDEANYMKVVALLLTRASELLNITNSLSVAQTVDLAFRIGKQYYFLRLEEILYVIQRATEGAYGKDYNRLDAATVMGWLERYDVDERTPIVTSQSTQKADESAKPLNDEQLKAYYQRVADGEKSDMSESKRTSDDMRDAQREARARYVQEKASGAVLDSDAYEAGERIRLTPEQVRARDASDEYMRSREGIQRLEDTTYEDVTNHETD